MDGQIRNVERGNYQTPPKIARAKSYCKERIKNRPDPAPGRPIPLPQDVRIIGDFQMERHVENRNRRTKSELRATKRQRLI